MYNQGNFPACPGQSFSEGSATLAGTDNYSVKLDCFHIIILQFVTVAIDMVSYI